MTFRERQQNLWNIDEADAIVITTNGDVKKDGTAVMGRGCAREANLNGTLTAVALGDRLKERGNHVFCFVDRYSFRGMKPQDMVSFPVKNHWQEAADLELIRRSATELVYLTNAMGWKNVALPRPGCGNGGLAWAAVRPYLRLLDERFILVTFPGEEPEEEVDI